MSTLSIFDAARETPDAPALLDGRQGLTFAQAAERCEPLCTKLREARQPFLPLTPLADIESVLWLYAAFATSTPVLTLHARSTEAERQRLTSVVSGQWSVVSGESDALVLIPTSGSTGEPRVVELSRRAIIASARASEANLGWQADDCWLLCLPLAHAGGLSILTRCLLARKPVLLFEPGPAGALERARDLAEIAQRASLISLVPSLLETLLDAGFVPPPPLRVVLLGGSACSPMLARRAHAARVPLLTSYGLTETASQVVTRRYAERFEPLAERDGCVSSGHALPDVELELRGDRLALRCASLLTRYVGETSSPIDACGWLVTGDRASFGAQGELFVHGRADDVIITGGENVDPLEVEAALRELPGVRDACVFGTPSSQFGQVVTAVLVTDDARLVEPQTLAQRLAGRLARHKWPRRAIRAEALPLTSAGKLDRQRCQELWAEVTPAV